MQTNEPCPRCKDGKLEEMSSTVPELDTTQSIIMGAALGIGFFPIYTQKTTRTYTCNKNCGYTDRREY